MPTTWRAWRAWRRPMVSRAGALAARLAGLGGRERPGPAASRSTCWRRSTGWPSGRWSTATGWRWSGPRWVDRWRCWRQPTGRPSRPSPRSLPRPIWRAGVRPTRSCATISTICAGPEGMPVRSPILRVAQIDVPVLLIHGDRDVERADRPDARHGGSAQGARQGCRNLHRAERYALSSPNSRTRWHGVSCSTFLRRHLSRS